MTRRDWWIGIALVTLAILVHALVPRYEWHVYSGSRVAYRIDRWSGRAEIGRLDQLRGWVRLGGSTPGTVHVRPEDIDPPVRSNAPLRPMTPDEIERTERLK